MTRASIFEVYRVFAHLNAEKSDAYRAVMNVFVEAKSRFLLHLRPDDVAQSLGKAHPEREWDRDTVTILLDQLCVWGNLEAHHDASEVATLEDFYRTRKLYQITAPGESGERALAVFHENLEKPGSLQTAALDDIRLELAALETLAGEQEPDAAKVHAVLNRLSQRFEELTSQAQTFMRGIQRAIDLYQVEISVFLDYKERLIDYLDRFVKALTIATNGITHRLTAIEGKGVKRLLELAGERELTDSFAPLEEERVKSMERWRGRWAGLRQWFIGTPGRRSQAEELRARARAAVPDLLSVVAAINERRMSRSDRPADLRTLARWFAECDSDDQAHRLWRAAFGLHGARHLEVNEDTLGSWEEEGVTAQTSWLEASPMMISPLLRQYGRSTRRGRARGILGRGEEKAKLALFARVEAEQLDKARQRLAQMRDVCLSDLWVLEEREFRLFFDLLANALSRKKKAGDTVKTLSTDGSLEILLTPTEKAGEAVIRTSFGTLTGPDYRITVRDVFGQKAPVEEPAVESVFQEAP